VPPLSPPHAAASMPATAATTAPFMTLRALTLLFSPC
jgi:hypothetical protein